MSFNISCLLFFSFSLFASNEDGNSSTVYSIDWNGSAFLVSGDGLVNEPYPNLTVYENNYYIFINSSSSARFCIGENNQTIYSGNDIWNSDSIGNDKYLLFSPNISSPRSLYYFNPDNNNSTGQISVLDSTSNLFYPQTKVQEAKFGKSISINDWNQTIVGAPGEDVLDGRVYIFDLENNGSFTQAQEILNPIPLSAGQFGDSIETYDQYLFISSPDYDSFSGSVYIYQRESNGTYSFIQELNNFSNIGDNFGWGLSVDGDQLAVASLEANNSKSGKVLIFENNGTSWNFDANFTSDDNATEDRFGFDLALNNNRLLVGVPKSDANGANSGAAYIFEKNATLWEQKIKLSPSDLSSDDEFGYSVALSNNIAFVGARQRDVDENTTNAGVVYVFLFDGSNWNEINQIYPDQNTSGQFFGSDLVVYEDILGVSSPMQGEGFLYLYRLEDNGSNISMISRLSLEDANSTDASHLSIAIKEGMSIVGIPGESIFEDAGGGGVVFFNDGWEKKNLPSLSPVIHYDTLADHIIQEDSGIYVYDFNGSHPYESNLTWSVSSTQDVNASINQSTGIFQFSPDGNFSGVIPFTVKLSSGLNQDIHDFNITVIEVNDAPVFNTQSISVGMVSDDYNQTLEFFDDENDTLILSSNDLPAGILIEGNKSLIGVPNSIGGKLFEDYNFTLTLSDGELNSSRLFTLRVLQYNDAPKIYVDDNSSIHSIDITVDEDFNDENDSIWISLLPHLDYNDTEGHDLFLNLLITPSYGVVDLNLSAVDINQTVIYKTRTIDKNFNGFDTFTIKLDENVTNPGGDANKSDTLVFNITINPVNDPPEILSVPPNSPASANEGDLFSYTLIVTDPELSDLDANESLSVTFENLPSWLSYDANNSILSGVPSWSDYEESGPRQILIRVQDSQGLQDTQVFTLQVIPDNYPPVISEGSSLLVNVNEDSTLSNWNSFDLNVVEQDLVIGDLTWSILTPPIYGNASVSGVGSSPSSLIYVPDGNFTGFDSFDLKVHDSGDPNASDVMNIQINVLSQPDHPVFTSLTSGIAVKDYMFDYNITSYDADADSNLSITNLVSLPSWLNFVDNGNGTARLWGTPDQYDIASNLILLEVRDETNLYSVQAFTLSVLEVNNNPQISQGSSISFTHTEDLVWDGSSLISATDQDGQFLEWTILVPPSHGDLNVSGVGYSPPVLSYLPDGNYTGADSFEILVSDGIGFDSIQIQLEIHNVDDPPTFTFFPPNQSTIDNQSFEVEIVAYDAEGLLDANIALTANDWIKISSIDYNSGKIVLSGSPDVSDEGNNSVNLTVTDSTNLLVSETFLIDVIVLNYPPIINNGEYSVTVTMTEDVLASWVPPVLFAEDNETLSVNLHWDVFTQPNFGTATVNGIGANPVNLDYQPDGNFSGVDFFIVRVTDEGGIENSAPKSDSIIVFVDVLPVNDPPVFKSTPLTDTSGKYRWNDESSYVYEIKTFDADWNYTWHSIDLNVTGSLPDWLTFEYDGNGSGKLYGLAAVADEGNYSISLNVNDFNNTDANQTFTLEIEIDNYPPVFKSISEDEEINELILYIDEDSTINGIRGWVEPTDYLAYDPDPDLSMAQELSWSFIYDSNIGAEVNASGTGDRPDYFTYSPALNFYGLDIVKLVVNDGYRNSILPVEIKVRPIPDAPIFYPLPEQLLLAQEGAKFNLDIKTYDPDQSLRTIRVLGLPSSGKSWLKLTDHNSTLGTARLSGIPPSQSSGDRYQLTFVVTDETGRFSLANSQLIVDGKNLSPIVSVGAETTIHFDKLGNASSNDMAKLFATDREGDRLFWSLSNYHLPTYGFASVSGNGVQSPTIKYQSFSSQVQDTFSVNVSDGISSQEVKITALVVDEFDTFDVIQPVNGKEVPSGYLFEEIFKVSSSKGDSELNMVLIDSPSWLSVDNIGDGLFKVFGNIPTNIDGEITLNISFLEDGITQKSIDHTFVIVDSSFPEIKLLGSEIVQIRIDHNYSEFGYTAKTEDGTDVTETVQVIGVIDQTKPSLQSIDYQVEHSDGNISQLSRVVQVVDLNYSVVADEVISFDDNVSTFEISSSGIISLEKTSTSEWSFNKYKEYRDLQNPEYSLIFKAPVINMNQCVSTKDNGYIISGIFRGTLEFADNLVVSKGNHDFFIMKLDSTYKRVWFKVISCTSAIDNISIIEGADSSIIVGGNFSDELFTHSQNWKSQGGNDNFIWKLDSKGNTLWLKSFGGVGDEQFVGLEGLLSDFFIAAINTTKSDQPTFSTIVKFSSDGEILDGISFDQLNSNMFSSIKVDGQNIIVGGQFEKSFDLNGVILTTDQDTKTSFVSSLDIDLKTIWAKSFESTEGTEVVDLGTDSWGYPCILLGLAGNSISGSGLNAYSAQGDSDLMVLKLDQTNGNIIWQKPIASSGQDSGIKIATDKFGMILIGANIESPFSIDGKTTTQGNQFLFKVESDYWGKPSFKMVENLDLKEGHFFQQTVQAVSPSFVRTHLLNSPSWMEFYDNKDGTAILGGVPSGVSSSNQSIKIRGYTMDGGFADLDINYTVSADQNMGLFSKELPSFKKVINFGNHVSITMVNESLDGKYFVGGNFDQSITFDDNLLTKSGINDSFVFLMESNGTIIKDIHLISSGQLRVGNALTTSDGNTYIIGDFSKTLNIGEFEVKSHGASDLFILQWGSDGNVKNLSSLGGVSNEFFQSATHFENKLYLTGLFEGTFSFDSHSVTSKGGFDGFILQTTTNDVSSIEWLQSFGGESNDKVVRVERLESGQLLVGGNFSLTCTFGNFIFESEGLTDCFVAYLSDIGNWEQVSIYGGSGEDELTGLASLSDGKIMLSGNYFGSFKCGEKETLSAGKRDGFVALLNKYGDCISLKSFGGAGSDGINSIFHNDGQVVFTGTFSNQISLGDKTFFTRGLRDSYLVLMDSEGSQVLDSFQLGGDGEDVTVNLSSAFSGNILLSGISAGLVEDNGIVNTTENSPNAFIFFLSNSSGHTGFIQPTIFPPPLTEIPSSSLYRYNFSTGPWPKGRGIQYSIINKPAWLNIEIDKDGNGVAWGESPMLTGGKEYVKFDLNSSLNGAIRCEWEINIIADAKSISLLGEPQLSISKDSEYKSEFRILGENLNNTLLFLKNPPSWLSLVRETEHKFYLSGTPREIGTYTVNILGNKYIDQNRSFQDEINFQINVQPKIVFDSNSTNIGNWRTNWFGYFNSFQDSWVYHKDFTWIFFGDGNQSDSIWFWNEKWGWFWTGSNYWNGLQGEGFLYNASRKEWMFFRVNQANLNYQSTLYSYTEEKWLNY